VRYDRGFVNGLAPFHPGGALIVDKRCTAAVVLIAIVACASNVNAQVFSDKIVGQKSQALADSLKHSDYPYALPIWGDKATARGFKLPYSAGLSLQYFGQRSDLVIDNLMVGFNNNAMYELDGLVRFDKAKSRSDGISFRPDIWLFPFLNVYGILGRSAASTDVGYGLWLPDSTGAEREVLHLETKVDFDANTFGLGLTPTIGVGGGWLALDMNYTWTDVPQLDDPATAFVFDPRMGKSFQLRNPDENINFWVGGFRLKINTGTTGSIPLTDAIPIDELQSNVDEGLEQVAQLNAEVESWWNSLSPPEQANPANKARYEASKAALARAGAFLDSANTALTNAESASVQYSIDKRPEDMWNFIAGGQYQLNRSWMFRLEVGFLSSRTHVITGVQYRFGL
jgi:hypothetical protein